MDVPLESLGGALVTFRPRTGTLDQWNDAYARVEDYLRAHRIHNRLHQSRLILRILERAARRHEENPRLNPTTLAAEEAGHMMDAWFGEILRDQDLSADRIAVAGRVALLLTDGPQKNPYAFLNEEQMPAEFTQAMRQSSIEAGPDLAVSNMVPRPIDLGTITEVAGETIERFEKWPLLRALFLWLVFTAALGAIFYISR